MFIDLDQISSTGTFLCDPDLDFSLKGHLIILANLLVADTAWNLVNLLVADTA